MTRQPRRRRPLLGPFIALTLALLSGALAGCFSFSEQRPRATGVTPDRPVRDIAPILRGTIGASASLRGDQPLLASGYGIVVGLNATGSSDIPPQIRGYMERVMAQRGVGQTSRGMGGVTPARMLDDENTAVVIVQAAIPAGAPKGSTFDVLVTALPGSGSTSLEGGRLWTTDLRPGPPRPGGPDTQAVAQAAGDVFINPFADPAANGIDAINRRTGRILAGGNVLETRELILSLDAPSHARARAMTAAINAKFRRGPGDEQPTAWGMNEELIQITLPQAWRDNTEGFVNVLMATRVDSQFPQEWARRYANELRSRFDLAVPLGFRLQALGDVAIPFLRDAYDVADVTPRMAALRAGARLGDPFATPHLKELAVSGPPVVRTAAIELLGQMPSDPQVNLALRELLDAGEVEVRITAYEALAERGDPQLDRRNVEDKFILDVLPAERTAVYITQQGKPRIAVFGAAVSLKRPLLISGWDDRLMLTADAPEDDVRIYYFDHVAQETHIHTIDPSLPRLIEFLAHTETPENPAPGLGLSYSEVVGALHEIWSAGGFAGDFVAEQDKLAAELLRSVADVVTEDRPEGDPEPNETDADESADPPLGARSPLQDFDLDRDREARPQSATPERSPR